MTLQCSAEAEAALANAERSKAVMPLCVGISAAAATFSLLATEQIQSKSQRTSKRFQSFGYSVFPAPIVGIFVPGALSTKAIVVAALAAVQSAFFCAQAENTLARATDAIIFMR